MKCFSWWCVFPHPTPLQELLRFSRSAPCLARSGSEETPWITAPKPSLHPNSFPSAATLSHSQQWCICSLPAHIWWGKEDTSEGVVPRLDTLFEWIFSEQSALDLILLDLNLLISTFGSQLVRSHL